MTRAAIEKNRITITVTVLICLGGYFSYRSMPRSQDPGFVVRSALVQTVFPGASPERIENLVTEPLEKAIQEIPELDSIISKSKTGVSIITVNIKEDEKIMRPIWDSLRRKVERASSTLPDGIIGPIVNDEYGDVFGTIVTITGDGYSYAELEAIADQTRDELLLLENIAKVDLVGAQEERVFLEFNMARLAEWNLSPVQLQQILVTQNILIPGGSIQVGLERIFLEPSGNFEQIEEIENTIIALPGRRDLVTLKDLVNVKRGYVDPPSRAMYSSGDPALGLAISLREGGNIIDLGRDVKDCIRHLQGVYPIGVTFDIVAFEPGAVQKIISGFTGNLLQAVLVVMLSMILFLGLRTGLVVATLIPSTILMTFLLMSVFNIGLDQISLAALIIALGLLVDNAIVMSESCLVQMGAGKDPISAAVDSANELKIPLLTSSLTTAAAFLPIFLAKSTTGEYTASLFKVVSIALLSSWVIALTLIPLLCASALRVKKGQDTFDTRFYRVYRRILVAFLKRPLISLAAIIAVFFIAVQGFRYIPVSFFPASDEPVFTVKLELAGGTAIEETSRQVRKVNEFIKRELRGESGGVTNWSAYVGEGAPRFFLSYAPDPPTPEMGYFIINVSNHRLIQPAVERLRTFCAVEIPDAKVSGQALPKGPVINSPIEVRLSGRETDHLFELAESIKAKLRQINGTVNIDDDWGLRTKKIAVRINQAQARRAGLSSQDIAISLQTALSGIETTQFREDDNVIPVVLRSAMADRTDLNKLEQLNMYAQATGRSVPLAQIANLDVIWEAPQIRRYNRLRTVTISSKLAPGTAATSVESELIPWLQEQKNHWPPGYRYEIGGEYETSGDSNQSIIEQLPIAAMIIILLLVAQFNSFRRPMIILATLPLGIIGVVVGLLITGQSLGFMAFLGVIALSGIVINNAIVLIDRIRIEIDENGLTPQAAMIESAQRRLRPILLTTVTTLVGLIPLWLGGGPLFEPMAVTIIFGLAFATALTLGVVPLFYCLLFRVRF